MNQIHEFAELRSEEVQEIFARPPKWLLRWGITFVFLLLMLVFVGAWAIRYPDIVRASFTLRAVNAPRGVVSRADGKIIQLFVREGQVVEKGTPLAYLESTANHEDVLRLLEHLRLAWVVARRGNLEKLADFELSGYQQLGELQNDYQQFEQSRIQLRAYLASGYYSQKKETLRQELDDLHRLSKSLQRQHKLVKQDARLAQGEVEVQRRLAAQKVIPALELNHEESKNIARQLASEQLEAALISNTTAQRAKQQEILELDRRIGEERDKFVQALNTLQSAAEAWQAMHVLRAPVTGEVYLTGMLQVNQAVASRQVLFYVAPSNSEYIGELRVPQHNSGKVTVGQSVLIKFIGFPHQEYGVVKGRIVTISAVSLRDSAFLAKVEMPVGLKTTCGRTLTYRSGMAASADIVTANTRLIEKLFYQARQAANM